MAASFRWAPISVAAALIAAVSASLVDFTKPAAAMDASTIPKTFTTRCGGVDCSIKKKNAFYALLVAVCVVCGGEDRRYSCCCELAGCWQCWDGSSAVKSGTGRTGALQVAAAHASWRITYASVPSLSCLPAVQNNFDANPNANSVTDSVIAQFVPLTGMSTKDKVHRKKRLQGMATLIADLNNASDIATVSVHSAAGPFGYCKADGAPQCPSLPPTCSLPSMHFLSPCLTS